MNRRLVWLCVIIVLLIGCKRVNEVGEPDCVSSSSFNEELRLTIVANRNEIEDKEVFAKEIFEMCKNNSFKSIILSTDIQGFPEKITAEIYLWKEEIQEKKPVLIVEYAILNDSEEYDMELVLWKERLFDKSNVDLGEGMSRWISNLNMYIHVQWNEFVW